MIDHQTNYYDFPVVDRLRATLDSIRMHGPDHFNMAYWYEFTPPWATDINPEYTRCGELHDASDVNINSCGTTACLAGHATLAAEVMGIDVSAWTAIQATAFLDLDCDSTDFRTASGSRMFYSGEWPVELTNEYHVYIVRGFTRTEAEYHVIVEWLERRIKDMEA